MRNQEVVNRTKEDAAELPESERESQIYRLESGGPLGWNALGMAAAEGN